MVVVGQRSICSVARPGAWPGRAVPMVPDTSKRNLLIFVAAVAIVLGGSQLLGYARLSSQERTDEQAKATGTNRHHTFWCRVCLMLGAPARSSSFCLYVQPSRLWSPSWACLSRNCAAAVERLPTGCAECMSQQLVQRAFAGFQWLLFNLIAEGCAEVRQAALTR